MTAVDHRFLWRSNRRQGMFRFTRRDVQFSFCRSCFIIRAAFLVLTRLDRLLSVSSYTALADESTDDQFG